MNQIKAAVRLIQKAKTIVIAGHMNPDGDCVGSMLALGLGLKTKGKRVYFLNQDGIPKKLRSLPGASAVRKTLKAPVDLAIAVDCSKKEMLGKIYGVFERAGKILEIDHHDMRQVFGDQQLIWPHASCVGEIIYVLLDILGVPLDKAIARNIFTSIIVETNSFRLPNVTPYTFSLCGRLLETGVDFQKVSELVYWSKTKEDVLISALALTRCTFLSHNRIVWSILKINDFKKLHAQDEDADAVANDMLTIKGVRIAILFRQKTDTVLRVSLRSKGKINVARIAENYGGGGHHDVAGCSIPYRRHQIDSVLSQAKKALARSNYK
ncbi:MAG: bifunctional oligoribonuclease/PAP phosphatase NrnA [Candidatus Omnitrophica bacterium]|nr:bifunctional oligoribonuclease/PAP phosphatase NrnA [Candidatus Omnitrophota bacterium]